jgi:hypothetical protein
MIVITAEPQRNELRSITSFCALKHYRMPAKLSACSQIDRFCDVKLTTILIAFPSATAKVSQRQ